MMSAYAKKLAVAVAESLSRLYDSSDNEEQPTCNSPYEYCLVSLVMRKIVQLCLHLLQFTLRILALHLYMGA